MLITEVLDKKVGQFVGIYDEFTKTFGPGQTFRVILYGAERMGAICPEYNGIAVLRKGGKARNRKDTIYTTVASRLARANSGYYGYTAEQKQLLEKLRGAEFFEFQSLLGVWLQPAA